MKKTIALLLVMVMISGVLSIHASVSASSASANEGHIIKFTSVYVEDNSLCAETTSILNDLAPPVVTVSESGFVISGSLTPDVSISILATVDAGNIVSATTNRLDFEVLSITVSHQKLRAVLREHLSDNLYYLECYDIPESVSSLKSYRMDWYCEYVSPQIVEQFETQLNSTTSSRASNPRWTEYTQTYSRTATILHEQITESIDVHFDYQWTGTLSSGETNDITCLMGISSKYAEWYDPITRDTDSAEDSSLCINNISLNMTTSEGQYMHQYYKEEQLSNPVLYPDNKVEIDFNVNLLSGEVGFGVTFEASSELQDNSMIYTFANSIGNGVSQARMTWATRGVRLVSSAPISSGEDVGDRVACTMRVKTDASTFQSGQQSFGTLWSFIVYSNGIDAVHGTDLPVYTANESWTNHLAYIVSQ